MAKKALLSAAEILAAEDLKTEDVDVPEWGGAIRLREWSGVDMLAYETEAEQADGSRALAVAISMSAIDEAGSRLFTADDVEALAKKNGKVLIRLMAKIRALNLAGEDGAKEASGN
ncbi:MAG: hypothetical protein ABL308_12685 [Oceanicaulis sp.]